MDEQRCSAPQILKNLGTPSPQRKDVTPETTVKPLQRQRSASFKGDRYWQVSYPVELFVCYSFISMFLIQKFIF